MNQYLNDPKKENELMWLMAVIAVFIIALNNLVKWIIQ